MKKITGVYLLLNTDTNQTYIGSSKNIERRFYQHRYNSRKPSTSLYTDMAKHNFEFIVLTECNEEELKEKEQQFINLLKPYYNRNFAYRNIEANQNEDFNEYHRLYLAKVPEYNESHKAYCRKWNESHKDYFRNYYYERKRSVKPL